jgi:hypothetical protein
MNSSEFIDKEKEEINSKTIFEPSHFEQMRKLADEEFITFILKIFYNENSQAKFENFFYKGKKDAENTEIYMLEKELKSKEFLSVGIFEDISYFPMWNNNPDYIDTANAIKKDIGCGFWKRIKGDGNCYYRGVLISYLELLILNAILLKRPMIVGLLIKDIFFSIFPPKQNEYKSNTIVCLCAIYATILKCVKEEIEMKGYECFDLLYRCYNKSDKFEKSLIFWIRVKLTNFLKENLDLDLNGIKLVQCIPGFDLNDDMTYDKEAVFKYIENDLMQMGEYVEAYPLYITPFLLKVSINIIFIDDVTPKLMDLNFNHTTPINLIENYLPDTDGFIGDINLLFRIPHYDCLYKNIFVEKILEIYNNINAVINEDTLTFDEYNDYKSDVCLSLDKAKVAKNPLTNLLGNPNKRSPMPWLNNENTTVIVDLSNYKYQDDTSQQQVRYNFPQVEKIKIDDEEEKGDDTKEKSVKSEISTESKKEFGRNCSICKASVTYLLEFPCKHGFCVNCFEKGMNKMLNENNTAKKAMILSVKSFSVEDIINTLRKIHKVKQVKCLVNQKNCKNCEFTDLTKLLEGFHNFNIQLQEEMKTHVQQQKQKVKEEKDQLHQSPKNNINKKLINNNKKETCKKCKKISLKLFLPCGCTVCDNCQKESIYRNNKKRQPIIFRKEQICPNKCLSCNNYELTLDDYHLFFKREEIEDCFNAN